MFSMFFGAGNSIFPLLIGTESGDMTSWAVFGMILTAVCVPITGVISMVFFKGDYDAYFFRLGKIPGMLLIALLMAMIGPLIAVPRCISLSYSTLALSIPGLPLWGFSLASCALIYVLVMRPGRLLSMLGYVLTPLLLVGILTVIGAGIINPPPAQPSGLAVGEAFVSGLEWGYNTLDLLAAFFFSSVVMTSLAKQMDVHDDRDFKKLIPSVLSSSFLAGFLLAVIYAGFAFVASRYSQGLSEVEPDQILGAVAYQILGPTAGIFATVTVIMACFTTEIALVQVFGTYLSEEIFQKKLGYRPCLVITLAITFLVSLLGFDEIVKVAKPAVLLLYPTFIVMAFVNLAHKLFGFKPIKVPILLTFVATVIFQYVL